jgi:hydroxymethylbilane synthase
MTNLKKCIVGIRDSKLSKAQTNMLIKDAEKFDLNKKSIQFEIQLIKTSGDIHSNERLDTLGGKGLFTKEIENQILNKAIDVGIHSMKDVPASDENPDLKIICWMKRHDPSDAFISNSGKNLEQLSAGSIIGTSSVRRRAQILNLRKDLQIKLLRGNVDTRLKKLSDQQYDGIILSRAGLMRIGQDNLITQILDHKYFLPAACQGTVGVQARLNDDPLEVFKPINHLATQIECIAERNVLKAINANCNSPISVYAKIMNDKLNIKCDLFDHNGSCLFRDSTEGFVEDSQKLSNELGNKIIQQVGQGKINQLNVLEDDFDYTPKD